MAMAAVVLVGVRAQAGVRGYFTLEQPDFDSPTAITGEVTGLAPHSKHGLAIHTFGNLLVSHGVPIKLGEHFNPHSMEHGGLGDAQRHAGDLGNLEANAEGRALFRGTSELVKLIGPQSVIASATGIPGRRWRLG
ncbi:hypothetical protein BASA81_001544 [Batrachochytrium salamandrivorans]|nr:hypothetical protein BASA81_001544 [Batrachochytrium salamandrivorans]